MTAQLHLMIAQARESVDLSQAELARRAGIPRSVMNVYEHGKRKPSAEMVSRILQAAGFRLVAEPIEPPVDPVRAGSILEQVIGLAEVLPFSPQPRNAYPPLAAAVRAQS